MSLPSEIYTESYYLEVCGGYEEFHDGGLASRLAHAIQLGKLAPGLNVLDIGSGRGEMALGCAETGCRVWGIDYSPAALGISNALLGRKRLGGLQAAIAFQRMNSKSLAFPRGFFDRVFLIDIVEHLYPDELKDTFEEVRRVTKPGGRVVIHTAPNAWLIKPIYLVAGILFHWNRHPWHVNEQSYLSLKKNLRPLGGSVKITVSKVPGFFRLGLGPSAAGSISLARIVRALDAVFDSQLSVTLVEDTPLKYVCGTDLWATIDIPAAEAQKAGASQ